MSPATSTHSNRFAYILAGVVLFTSPAALAADATWNSASGANWATGTNWNPTASPGATSGSTNQDTATFNGNFLSASKSITVDAGRNIKNITFDNTGAGFAYSLTGGSLVLSAGGTIQTTGAMTTGVATTSSTPVTLAGSYTFTSNASATTGVTPALTFNSGATITPMSSLGNINLTLNGATGPAGVTGSGVVGTPVNSAAGATVNGIISNGTSGTTLAVVKEGAGTWQLGAANTFTGGFTIKQGSVVAANNSALGAGTVTLGDNVTGQTAMIVLGSGINISRPISVAAGAGLRILSNTGNSTSSTFSGAITLNNNTSGLRIQNQTSARNLTISGGITGTGNVEIYHNNSGATTTGIILSGASINNVGTVTNNSPGAGSLTQGAGGVIGSNVTSFIQNSSTSQTTLSLANSFGTTFVNAGILATTGAGTLGTGDVTVDGGSLLLGNSISLDDDSVLRFISSGTATITLNYSGTDTVYALYNITTGASIGAGEWTAAQLNTFFGTSNFTGSGTLTTLTAVPEPSTVAMAIFVLGVLVVTHVRRRKAQAGAL